MKAPTSFFRVGKSFQKATVILLVLLVATYAIQLLYRWGWYFSILTPIFEIFVSLAITVSSDTLVVTLVDFESLLSGFFQSKGWYFDLVRQLQSLFVDENKEWSQKFRIVIFRDRNGKVLGDVGRSTELSCWKAGLPVPFFTTWLVVTSSIRRLQPNNMTYLFRVWSCSTVGPPCVVCKVICWFRLSWDTFLSYECTFPFPKKQETNVEILEKEP